jgi:hypothetical protein
LNGIISSVKSQTAHLSPVLVADVLIIICALLSAVAVVAQTRARLGSMLFTPQPAMEEPLHTTTSPFPLSCIALEWNSKLERRMESTYSGSSSWSLSTCPRERHSQVGMHVPLLHADRSVADHIHSGRLCICARDCAKEP